MIALCIVTHPKTYSFLLNLMESLIQPGAVLPPIYIVAGDYQDYTKTQQTVLDRYGHVITCDRATWEAGAIKLMNDQAPAEIVEFVFLQDTWELKANMFADFWQHMTNSPGRTIWFSQNCQMYAGKFRRSVLNMMPPWEWPSNKHKAVQMEGSWAKSYIEHDTNPIRWEQIVDGHEEFEMFGRLNIKCENKWLTKWKGTHTSNLLRRLTEIDEDGKV